MEQSSVPERIEVIAGASVVIDWDDGTTSSLDAARLRAACQCAECREPAGHRRMEEVVAGPEPITISEARLVGNYAINFEFAPDGHATGIFPFRALRALGMEDAAS